LTRIRSVLLMACATGYIPSRDTIQMLFVRHDGLRRPATTVVLPKTPLPAASLVDSPPSRLRRSRLLSSRPRRQAGDDRRSLRPTLRTENAVLARWLGRLRRLSRMTTPLSPHRHQLGRSRPSPNQPSILYCGPRYPDPTSSHRSARFRLRLARNQACGSRSLRPPRPPPKLPCRPPAPKRSSRARLRAHSIDHLLVYRRPLPAIIRRPFSLRRHSDARLAWRLKPHTRATRPSRAARPHQQWL
jgi:hypothetical protein